MRKRLVRKPILTLFLLAASAAGPLTGGTKGGLAPAAKNWAITVGPGPCDLAEGGKPCSTQTISKQQLHRIVWTSNAGQTLEIIVHVPPKCPAPFKKMTPAGTDPQGNALWAVDCKNGQCNSGPAEANACEQDYKYDQILGGKKCDGMIIIQP